MKSLNIERAATVLAEAIYSTDKATAERYHISTKTVQRYRKLLDQDTELFALFVIKKSEIEARWIDRIQGAIVAGVAYLERAAKSTDYSPEMVHAQAGSVKLLSQISITKSVIDARLEGIAPPEPAPNIIDQPGSDALTVSEDLTNE